jgi:hypothetical protein
METAIAAATNPLRSKFVPGNPTNHARSEILVQGSMEDLQVRDSTPDVVIHGLPTGCVAQIEVRGAESTADFKARLQFHFDS